MVANKTKQALKQINDISRQLLSRILAVESLFQESEQTTEESISQNKKNSQLAAKQATENHQLTELMSQRESLIKLLFQQNEPKDIQVEQALVNEMANLDKTLSTKSHAFKKSLADQVIKRKKAKNLAGTYQKL